jgi:nitronate monooxygenase
MLRTPVVLAPLAGGPSTPALAAAVGEAGGLGFLAAGYLSPDELDARIRAVRDLTPAPLGVNLFVVRPSPFDAAAVARYAAELEPEARRRGVSLGEPRFDDDGFGAKLEVVLARGVEVVSTTFGCPPAADIERLRAAGASVWLTVASLREARVAAEAGADALVLQGAEAGGHRACWDDTDEHDVPTIELVRSVAAELDLPLVATGGIVDGGGIATMLAAGATAAQLGTAFLLCPEAGTATPYRRALSSPGTTQVTRAFTGRRARAIVNAFMRAHPDAPSAYPQIHHLTAPLRAAAREANDADGINLWAGEAFPGARELPAGELVVRLAAEAAAAL